MVATPILAISFALYSFLGPTVSAQTASNGGEDNVIHGNVIINFPPRSSYVNPKDKEDTATGPKEFPVGGDASAEPGKQWHEEEFWWWIDKQRTHNELRNSPRLWEVNCTLAFSPDLAGESSFALSLKEPFISGDLNNDLIKISCPHAECVYSDCNGSKKPEFTDYPVV